jgi:hypothetical protein
MVAGMAHQLKVQGIVKWANEEIEEEAVDSIADNLGDEEVPEMVPEEGMDPEKAQEVLQAIVEVSQELANKTAGYVDERLNKTAAAMNYETAAARAAQRLMIKVAEETAAMTGPDVPGQSTPAEVQGPTAETEIDKVKNPSSEVVVPQGTTALDTAPGTVGAQTEQPQQPGAVASPAATEVSKLATLLSHLGYKKANTSGASLSAGATGGPAPTPRVDLPDNLQIPKVVAAAQGQTAQSVPASAMIGALTPQSATPGPSAPTPNDVSDDAISKKAMAMMQDPQQREVLKKFAQAYVQLAPWS